MSVAAAERRYPGVWPAFLLLSIVVGLPMLRVLQLGFSDVRVQGGEMVSSWAGFEAYARLWQDSRWWSALRNTLVFTTSSVALELLLGVGVALVLNRRFPARPLVRAIVILPWALPTAVMALAWAWIFNDAFGVLNDLFQRTALLSTPVAWLGEPATAMAALIVADVWKTTPFVALIVLAGLQSIPDQIVEAAKIDGLGAWQRLRHVVLPLIAPSLLVATCFRAVQAYGTFDLVYVMTGGGPGGSTETVSLYAYQNYFRYLDFAYGSAVATAGVLLPFFLAMILVRMGAKGDVTR